MCANSTRRRTSTCRKRSGRAPTWWPRSGAAAYKPLPARVRLRTGRVRQMKSTFSGLGALLALIASVCLAVPAGAQDQDEGQGGISSPLLSRCAGKFGATLRAGDQAFPLFDLSGVPWMNIERTNQTVEGAHVVAIVTGIGSRSRRRGEIVGLRYRCLIDDK